MKNFLFMNHSPNSNKQKAELSQQRLGTTQVGIAMKLAQNLCRSVCQDLHNLSLSQGTPGLLWVQHKAGLWTVKILSHCWRITLFFCQLLNVSSLDAYKVKSVLLCALLCTIAECASEQLLSEVSPDADNLVIIFVSVQSFAFVFLRLWKDHTHSLLYLLKCGSKVEKYSDVHEV